MEKTNRLIDSLRKELYLQKELQKNASSEDRSITSVIHRELANMLKRILDE